MKYLQRINLPDFPLPKGFAYDETIYLKFLVYDGAENIYGTYLPEFVKDRLDFELDIICKKGYIYQLLIFRGMG